MNNEIKRIIEELKDNIPIEEYRSEGTSDGLTHYEEDKDSWQYKLLDYITNLQQKYEIAQKDIESLKNNYNDLIKMSENKIDNLQEENERLKNFIDNLISTFNHCEINGTKKLDIVSDYIKQEYENILKDSDNNEKR